MAAKKDSKRPQFTVYTIRETYAEFDKQKQKKIDFGMYKKIISKFLFIYVSEVIFMNKTYYFPMTGRIMLNKCGNWIKKDESNYKVGQLNQLKKTNWSLGFFWYERLFSSLMFTKLKKMTGSTNILPLLERDYKKTNNIDNLKTANELKEKFKITKPHNYRYEEY